LIRTAGPQGNGGDILKCDKKSNETSFDSRYSSRLLESRSHKRELAEEQQEKLRRLQLQRERAENDFREANVERIRRSKSVTLPTPTTP
jgi:hypothetical protein